MQSSGPLGSGNTGSPDSLGRDQVAGENASEWRQVARGCNLGTMRAFETVHAEPESEITTPRYRVNFWSQSGEAWALEAWILEGVSDVGVALAWIDENKAGRLVELFVEVDDEAWGGFSEARRTSLARLLGRNPNSGKSVTEIDFEAL